MLVINIGLLIMLISILIIEVLSNGLNWVLPATSLVSINSNIEKRSLYECGFNSYMSINSMDSSYIVSYYLILIIFIVFDIEIGIIYPIVFNSDLSSNIIIYIIIYYVIIGVVYELSYNCI